MRLFSGSKYCSFLSRNLYRFKIDLFHLTLIEKGLNDIGYIFRGSASLISFDLNTVKSAWIMAGRTVMADG